MANELLANYQTRCAQKLFRGVAPAGGGSTDPVFRAMGTPTSGSFNSLTVNAPATAVAGDLLIAVVQHLWGAGVISPAPGWTALMNTIIGGNAWNFGIFVKIATAGDPGNGNTFTVGGAAQYGAYIMAYSGVDTTLPLTTMVTASLATPNSATDTPSTPASVPNKYMSVVHYYHGAPASTVTTPPAGATVRLPATNESTAAFAVYEHADATAASMALVWSQTGSTGAANIWIAGIGSSSTAGGTVVYTVPANARTTVTDITVVNLSASPSQVSISLGGNDVLHNVVIATNTSMDFECEQVMAAGDTIIVAALGQANVHISGEECF